MVENKRYIFRTQKQLKLTHKLNTNIGNILTLRIHRSNRSSNHTQPFRKLWHSPNTHSKSNLKNHSFPSHCVYRYSFMHSFTHSLIQSKRTIHKQINGTQMKHSHRKCTFKLEFNDTFNDIFERYNENIYKTANGTLTDSKRMAQSSLKS